MTVALEAVREERSRELFQRLVAAGFPLTGDSAELGALLSAAINYLAVRSRDIKLFAGLPIDGEAAWTRLETVMGCGAASSSWLGAVKSTGGRGAGENSINLF